MATVSIAPTNKERTKQTRLSIEDRVKILERLDNGERATDLAREYKVSRSGITFIKKSKEYLLRQRHSLIMCQGQTSKKRCTGVENSPLEQALYEWFLERKNMGESVTGVMLQEKALELNKTLNGTNNFKGTNGFISKFKKRHSIRSTVAHGDKDFVEQNTNNFCQELIKYIMYNKIPLDKVYNAKETGFYWKTLPNRTLADDNCQIPSKKTREDKVTLMVCTNATGSHKLSIFIVGKASNSHFKNIKSLPFIYKEQVNASMDKKLMLNWYHEVFLSEVEQVHESNNEQCLLLLNNVPSYPSVEEFNSISERCQVINLPTNASSYIQPMDQGIHEKLKKIYRKHFLQVMLTAETSEDVQRLLKSLNILKLCHLIHDAWNEVTEIVIRDSWKNIFPLTLEPELDPRAFLNMVVKIPEYNKITLEDINLWLNSDNNKQENQVLNNEEEILPNHSQNNNQEVNQETEEMEQENNKHPSDNESINVTAKSAVDAIGTFLFWYQAQNQCSPQDFQYLQKFWKLALAEILPTKDD